MLNKVIASLGIVGVVTIGAFFSNKTEAPAMTVSNTEMFGQVDMGIVRESGGEIYEYPSIEDLEIIEDIPQDSVVNSLMFQETLSGDVYSIK